MSYTIQTRNTLKKDVKRIPDKFLKEIYHEIDLLAEDPYREGVRKVKGSDELYRIRVGDYRVLYEIDDKNKILMIVYIRHRKDAYRGL